MKILLNAILFAYVPFVAAQSADTATPPALVVARARFRDAIAVDTKHYLSDLARLKAAASQTGNAALADAVNKEIASVRGNSSTDASIPTNPHSIKLGTSSDGESSDDLAASLVSTTWVWNGGETFTLLPNGKAQWSGIDAPTMTWKVVGSSPPIIVGIAHNGLKYKMKLDPTLQSGTLVEGDMPVRITARIVPKQGG